jgi:hypothetical protein
VRPNASGRNRGCYWGCGDENPGVAVRWRRTEPTGDGRELRIGYESDPSTRSREARVKEDRIMKVTLYDSERDPDQACIQTARPGCVTVRLSAPVRQRRVADGAPNPSRKSSAAPIVSLSRGLDAADPYQSGADARILKRPVLGGRLEAGHWVLVPGAAVRFRPPQLEVRVRDRPLLGGLVRPSAMGTCVRMTRGPAFDKERLATAVAASFSYSDVLRRLRMRPAGGNHATVKKYVAIWNIPTDHFDPSVARRTANQRRSIPLREVLVEGSTYDRGKLKQRLFETGMKERRCELCGQEDVWRGKAMSLILDHVNGNASDNALENLRIVCPNCAATLDTHCGRNAPICRSRRCLRCGCEFRPRAATQRYCSRSCGQRSDRGGVMLGVPRPESRKVERPPYEVLVREVEEIGFCAVGRKYGVSDNAVRKWLRWYANEQEAQAPRDQPSRRGGETTAEHATVR